MKSFFHLAVYGSGLKSNLMAEDKGAAGMSGL
jgi:hypothetical protein